MSDNASGIFRVLETGDAELAATVVAADCSNATAVVSPPACGIGGPAGIVASSAWLRAAFPDLRFEVADVVSTADKAWLRLRMLGRHSGPFARYQDGALDQVTPPTGRQIDVDQIHLLGLRDGKVVWHDAVRDDLALLGQLGVFPPHPATLARMVQWRVTGRAQRAGREVAQRAADAAEGARRAIG